MTTTVKTLDTGDLRDEFLLSPRRDGLFASFNDYSEAERDCRGKGVTLPWDEVRAVLLTPRTLP